MDDPIRTNYEGHDDIYKNLRSQGTAGWDKTEEAYDEQKELIQRLTGEGHFPRSGTVLELGCGAGNLSIWFAGQGYQVSGTDISPTAIEWAREKAQGSGLSLDLRVGNVIDLRDYEDRTFDIVVDGHCFHCIIGQDRTAFLASAFRVLKAGGTLLINTMCGDMRDGSAKVHFDPKSRCLIYDGIATRYIGLPERILGEIRENGFTVQFSEVMPDPEGCDDLLIVARKPA